jgi:DNA-binding beta-propeller fold protein YncE
LLSESGSFIGQSWSRKSRPLPENYSEGLAPAVEGELWGYLYRSRKVIIPFQSDNKVTKLRASDGAQLGAFAVGSGPSGVAFDGANIWVVNSSKNTVSKL